MRTKHQKTLGDLFSIPSKAGILWKDIEALLVALGAEITEGNGSRVRIALNGERAVFHRPHPRKEANKGAVADMREFLNNAGIRDLEKDTIIIDA